MATNGKQASANHEESRKRKFIARDRWLTAANHIQKKQRMEKILQCLGLEHLRRLCDGCESMKLTAEKFRVRTNVGSILNQSQSFAQMRPATGIFDPACAKNKFSLGTLKDIWDRQWCSFCNLVMKAAQEQSDTVLETHSEFASTECWASWQLDGCLAMSENGQIVQKPMTRRIKLHWSLKELQDSYIVLMPDPTWPADHYMMGRYVDSSRANYDLIQRWVRLCEDNHGKICGTIHGVPTAAEFTANVRKKAFFGVIDVDSECLVNLPDNEDYIALSYAWGDVERFTTVLENVGNLQRPKGLSDVMTKIPRSIRDAIRLTRNLNKRYLWVDALCIVQDNEDVWNLNAQIMDQIYGNAYLTICAADDPDASAGLVALDPSQRKFSQYTNEYKKGVTLMVSHLSETYIRRSNWNQRAWTFQERLLSRRCLLFTRGRVYFQCRATAMSEDIIAEHDKASWSIELVHAPLQMLANLNTRALSIYAKCVELYTERQLSRKADILSAFNGITNLLGRSLHADFVFGLPESHFDWALLWEPRHVVRKRDSKQTRFDRNLGPPPKVSKFPSWSWCGWQGQVYYKPATMMGAESNLQDWLTNRTWIIWFIRDGHGDLRMLKRSSKMHSWSELNAAMPRSAENKKTDVLGRPLPNEAGGNDGTKFFRVLSAYPFNTNIAPEDAKPHPNRPDMRFLQFWSWSGFFWLRAEASLPEAQEPYSQRYGVVDQKGDWCGTVVLDGAFALNKTVFGSKYAEIDFESPFELIAISDAKAFTEEECPNWTYYIQKEREQAEWDLYYVLLIVRNKEGIAHRIGLGKTFKQAFTNSVSSRSDDNLKMQWREFILE